MEAILSSNIGVFNTNQKLKERNSWMLDTRQAQFLFIRAHLHCQKEHYKPENIYLFILSPNDILLTFFDYFISSPILATHFHSYTIYSNLTKNHIIF